MTLAVDPHGDASSGALAGPSRETAKEIDRDIWAMAWPSMLSLLVVNLVDVIDVAVVGRLGRPTVAAWGYATQCVHVVETLVQSVGIGCVALIARAVGAGDPRRARRALAGSLGLSQGVAVTGLLLATIAPRAVLGALDAGPDVIDIAVPFFRLSAAAMVLYGAAFMFESQLRAHKNTRGPMFVAFAVMGVKTTLSLLLVFGELGLPRLGLAGAGMATLAAHATGLALYLRLARRAARERSSPADLRRVDRRGFWEVAADVARVSLPSMGERLLMELALLTYFTVLSRFGTAAVAAYAIGVRLLSISWIPGVGFGAAASTFVGQALGACDSVRARQIGVRALRQALGVMGILGVLFAFLRSPLAAAFTNDARIAEALTPFMLTLALAQPFMGAHFTLAGVLRGAGDTVTPLCGAAIGNWVFRVPLAWLATRVLGASLGSLAWVWAAVIADHFTRMLINGGVFLFGRWDRRTGARLGSWRASPENTT